MKLTGESKVLLAIVGITAVIIALAAVVMTKPAPVFTRTELIPPGAHTKGNPDAANYLVEFSDFQCPACAAIKPLVDQIIKENEGNLLFVYRHFPLTQHPFAQKAAEAAEAAEAQGKFWEMFDLLFANQDKLSDSLFTELAAQLKLDTTVFTADLSSGKYRESVLADLREGNRLGINATPTFFLNGRKLDLSSYADLKTAVEQALNK
jgi:protein-disulfide isomerase